MSSVAISDKTELLMRYFMNIRLNKVTELKETLELDRSVVDAISRDGFDGLQLACKYGFVEVSDVLLSGGISATVTDAKYGRTCLHWASINGHNEVVSFLTRDHSVQLATILDLADSSGHTALMHAVKGGRVQVVRLLFAAGASLAGTVKVKAGATVKTVFDLCNKSEELIKILREEESRRSAPMNKLISTSSEVKSDDIVWGLTGTTHLSHHSQTRKKCIEFGWIQQRVEETTTHSATTKNRMVDVIVKLNRDDRELQAELTMRTNLNTPTVSPEDTNIDSSSITTSAAYTNPHIVQLLHSNIVTLSDKGGTWHGIILQKGLLDLHHLCDYMHQSTTHSRLQDLRWKVNTILKLCTVCLELSNRDLVWYDLKPSNFIVFPATIDANGKSNKLHHWLQHSTWDTNTISLKAADLSSVYPAGCELDKMLISCTAKYLHPAVATALSQNDSHTLCSSAKHMMWSFGMTALQLLHHENKTLFAHYEVINSEQVYAFLTQDPSVVQEKVYDNIKTLVEQQCCKDVLTMVCTDLCDVLKSLLTVESCVVSFQGVKSEFERILTQLN